MLYIVDKVVKLGGVYLPGEVTDVSVDEVATIDDVKDKKGKTKKNQPTGYEAATVEVKLLFEKRKDMAVTEQIRRVQQLFKPPKQKKAKLLKVVDTMCAARGITSVYFSSFTTERTVSETTMAGTLKFTAPKIAGIKVKKKSTKNPVAAGKKKTAKKKSAKSAAKDTQKTGTAKKKARELVK